MTDVQILAFSKKLNEYFEYLKTQLTKKITNKQMDSWGNSLFYRYRYGKTESNNKSKLPKEHVETLEKILKELNITPEEYLKTRGKTDILVELIKIREKQEETKITKENEIKEKNMDIAKEQTLTETKTEEVKVVRSLEQLIKLQEDNDMEISILRQKHSERYRKFYKISKEEYEKTGQEISRLLEKRKEIGKKIEQMENAKKLLTANIQLDAIISTTGLTKEEIETINITDIDKKKLEKENTKKVIQQPTKKIEKVIQQPTKKFTKTEKKELIVKMLCKNEFTSLNDIKNEFIQKNIDTENLIEIMQELRIEIPGIVKQIKEDGRSFSYSIKVDALKQMEEYQKMNICPTIYNMDEGTFSFIVRADMHLNMNSSKETIQKMMYPYLNFCTLKQNMPIIDLGDLADTIGPFAIKDWKSGNKEAIKQAYNFYKNYAKTLSSAPNIKHYTLFGNHENHPYYVGIDPLEIINENSNNFYLLGFSKGEFKIGNDKIGVFHDKTWQNVISNKEEKDKTKRDEYIYEYLCEEMKEIAKNYIYSLIGHYHFGRINPNQNFAVINNGLETALMFTAKIENNQIEKMYVEQLLIINNNIRRSDYQIEIYSNEKKYNK